MIQCLDHTSNWPHQNDRWNVGVSLNFGEVWTPCHQWLRLWMHGNMGHVAAAAPIMQLETLHRAFSFLAGPAGTCDSTCVLVDWNRRPATHHNSAITYCQCCQRTLALLPRPLKTDTCLTVFSRTTWVSRHQKSQTILDFNEARVDGVAVASAGPYADHLQLAPDRQPHQHLITQFLQLDALSDVRPTASKHRRSRPLKSLEKLVTKKLTDSQSLSSVDRLEQGYQTPVPYTQRRTLKVREDNEEHAKFSH